MDLEDAKFLINDGQHRCAAISAALNENPALGKERISVLLFPWESLDRAQQMFTDLNRFVHNMSKSLNILYDHRAYSVGIHYGGHGTGSSLQRYDRQGKVDHPVRSNKLFTLSTLYDANEELVGTKLDRKDTQDYKKKLDIAVAYWNAVAEVIPDWGKVKEGTLPAPMLRQEKINTHGVVLRALGGLGKAVIEAYPDSWRQRLTALKNVDLAKNPLGTRSIPSGKMPASMQVPCSRTVKLESRRSARLSTRWTRSGAFPRNPSHEEREAATAA